MKYKQRLSANKLVLASVSLAATAWVLVPLPDALGTNYWTYPDSSTARAQRIQELNGLLDELSAALLGQQEAIRQSQKALVDLEASLAAAQKALVVEERPVTEVVTKYRKAQELSLIDPMVSTETQRLELIKVKEANNPIINKRKGEIEALNSKIPQTRASITNAQGQLNAILQQIDMVIKQRDEVSEQVFLKTVAN